MGVEVIVSGEEEGGRSDSRCEGISGVVVLSTKLDLVVCWISLEQLAPFLYPFPSSN
jgi:hypothetical protein